MSTRAPRTIRSRQPWREIFALGRRHPDAERAQPRRSLDLVRCQAPGSSSAGDAEIGDAARELHRLSGEPSHYGLRRWPSESRTADLAHQPPFRAHARMVPRELDDFADLESSIPAMPTA